jgi:hypothetical protein
MAAFPLLAIAETADQVEAAQPKVWKRQRQTARQVYHLRRDEDIAKAARGEETREGQVLRLLAAHWNATQCSPTARELFVWAVNVRQERLDDINSIRPRISMLVDQGLVETRQKRRCAVSGKTVNTWAIREIGSKEAR